MIIFVGDKPSKKNLDPNIPFVGTKSYKTLLNWIYKMNIDISDVKIYNKNNIVYSINAKYIALGNEASKVLDKKYFEVYTKFNSKNNYFDGLEKRKLSYFKLPHPSGLNRKLNNKKWLDKKLKECKEYLDV